MSKKRVLIIGATGMLGHVVYFYLKPTNKYYLSNSVYRNKLTEDSIFCDVKNQNEIGNLFKEVNPDIVVNCVGALVQASRKDPTNAIYLNALLPHILKDMANEYNAKLIHISTDCVFSGKSGSYAEDDFRDADDIYGRSKALGEISDYPHCTLRTSIIGPELKKNGQGLMHWFSTQVESVNGFTSAIWSGVTTLELAKVIEKVIDENLTEGLYHVTNGIPISKYDLLHLLREESFSKVNHIVPYDRKKVDKSLQRSRKYNFEIPDYVEMVKDLRAFIKSKDDLYPDYLS